MTRVGRNRGRAMVVGPERTAGDAAVPAIVSTQKRNLLELNDIGTCLNDRTEPTRPWASSAQKQRERDSQQQGHPRTWKVPRT